MEVIMTKVLIRHRVNDYAAFKAVFDDFAGTRKSAGEKSFLILHHAKDPKDLVLLFEWDNQANAEKFFVSPALKSAMQRAGVAEQPKIEFLDESARGTL
jgi:quinol monooxygenase YgiN